MSVTDQSVLFGSQPVFRNVSIEGRRTSIRLEPEIWSALVEVQQRERVTIHELCTAIVRRAGPDSSLASAIRVFVMSYFRAAATNDGHRQAGHGHGGFQLAPGGLGMREVA